MLKLRLYLCWNSWVTLIGFCFVRKYINLHHIGNLYLYFIVSHHWIFFCKVGTNILKARNISSIWCSHKKPTTNQHSMCFSLDVRILLKCPSSLMDVLECILHTKYMSCPNAPTFEKRLSQSFSRYPISKNPFCLLTFLVFLFPLHTVPFSNYQFRHWQKIWSIKIFPMA